MEVRNMNILIVEDSPTQAMRLKLILEDLGYEVIHAINGAEALKLLEDHTPVLIISDVMMPEMDGFEFCKRVKKHQEYKKIPLLLLTSLKDKVDVIKGLILWVQILLLLSRIILVI